MCLSYLSCVGYRMEMEKNCRIYFTDFKLTSKPEKMMKKKIFSEIFVFKYFSYKKNVAVFADGQEGFSLTENYCNAGNDFLILNKTSTANCLKKCRETKSCIGFSYNFQRKKCWLKTKLQNRTFRPNNIMYRKLILSKFSFFFFIFVIKIAQIFNFFLHFFFSQCITRKFPDIKHILIC